VGCPIVEILKVISLFLSFISNNMNNALQEEMSEKEMFQILSLFQRCKILAPNGLTVKFYLRFFDQIKWDLLKVVNESKRLEKVWGSYNSTFLSLIPKTLALSSFEDFRPIFCCNLIYKLIAKIITNHLKLLGS
jgi:hypothetical protein